MSIRYTSALKGVTEKHISGFFMNWRNPLSATKIIEILNQSDYVYLAIDEDTSRVVGLINALSDDIQAAFIPLLEVLPDYRHQGIGQTLVKKMLEQLQHCPSIDLTCDPDVQPFYEKCGMQRSTGMVIRNFD